MSDHTRHDQKSRLVWDTHDFSQHLMSAGSTKNHKNAETWQEQQAILPNIIDWKSLRDEDEQNLKPQVVEHLLTNTKKRRYKVMFIQTFCFRQSFYLIANDNKGNRCWIRNDQPWNNNSLREAIKALVRYNKTDTLLFPHEQVCKLFRHIWLTDKQKPLLTENGRGILAMCAYPAKLQLIKSSYKTNHITNGNSHLDRLEAESIYIIREVLAHAKKPVMLYSIGKDSSVMLHLARKAFHPSTPPFPLLHIDTRWKFQEMYQFRDQMAAEAGMELITHINPEGVERNISPFVHGSALHTDTMKTQGLKQAIDQYQFDVAFGGARRDEEKSRAKERIFSFRNAAHRWDPKNQRPELWNLYNGHKHPSESIRVFPISNWTELDIWQYIYRENIPIVPLYYAQLRPVIKRDNMLMMIDDHRLQLMPNEQIQLKQVRFRTLGCYPLTGAIESDADNLEDIILELLKARTSERQGRAIDIDTTASMEKKKQEGYF